MIKQEDLVHFFNELDRIVAASNTEDSQPVQLSFFFEHKINCSLECCEQLYFIDKM